MNKGFSIVEILVSIGIFSIIVFAVVNVFVVSNEASQIGNAKTKAVSLMTEYLEKVRNIRRSDWNLLIDNRYIIVENAGNVSLQANAVGETIGDYTRSIDIEAAYRDTNGNLVPVPGAIDPSTKKITVTISWVGVHPGQLVETTYLTRYLDNLAWIQTTEAEFNAGTKTAVAVTNTDGGEVILGAGGHGDWCEPNQSIVAELDLPKNGVANALSAYEGRAIAGTGENASGVSLADISITTNTNPPIPTVQGTFDGYKTNDVFLEGNYGYIATDNNQKEVVIVDLNSYQEVGHFDTRGIFGLGANANATSVYVSGNKGYVTAGLLLYIFDLSEKTGSRPQSGVYLFLGIATSVVVKGNYAYVSLASSTWEMQIIDISNPQNLFRIGWADVNGADGKRIFVNQTATRAYLATGASSNKEFFIIDIASKSGSRPVVGSYEANGMNPKNLSIVPGNKAILVGTGAEEYQVIDITNEGSPSRCGGLNIDSGIRGVAGILESDGDAYSYIVTGDSNAEFKIIEGGPGGVYAASGIFESQTLNTNYSTAFNRFFVNAAIPSQTSITYQMATKDAVGGNCTGVTFSNFDFVGSDGTSASFFSADDAIPLSDDDIGYENPAQCFRFRAYLSTSDFSQTPILYDFTLNYSP